MKSTTFANFFILAAIAVLGAILALVLFGLGSILTGTTAEPGWTSSTLQPCPTEDSDNCYWDAQQHGNDRGTSFVTIDNHTYYLGD